jgi:uncharacterized protein YceH (UPF0502 family)
MDILLTEAEARVLGSLVEKSLTTPELYPLTLNALVNACNQKSSREPVMSLDYAAVEDAVKSLVAKGYAAQRYEPGGRTAKYGHRAEVLLATEDAQAIGLVCVLLLRGPQTVGELKTRTERLCSFADLPELDRKLQELAARADGPIVERLPRQPGQKETRWRQLLTAAGQAAPAAAEPVSAPKPAAPPPQAADRVAALEARVAELERRLAALEKPA